MSMTLISEQTVTASNVTSVSFTSIPQTYTDFRVEFFILGSSNTGTILNSYINSAGGTCGTTWILGNGSSTSGGYNSAAGVNSLQWFANTNFISNTTPTTGFIDAFGYANTNYYKSFLCRVSGPGNYVGASSGMWASTAAITGIDVNTSNGGYYWAVGSVFRLWGIK